MWQRPYPTPLVASRRRLYALNQAAGTANHSPAAKILADGHATVGGEKMLDVWEEWIEEDEHRKWADITDDVPPKVLHSLAELVPPYGGAVIWPFGHMQIIESLVEAVVDL